ncbi:MAG: 3-keto-5-aminohexanoate cleavage protein [Geminicoccaceae bacterium]|nr:3-keto-5-aminohexanoate cleavage protein [Geminicoccaceae bacterium]
MILQACLNGVRPPGWHPALPVTAEDLAEDGRACVRAGAAELHVHVRGRDGRESLAPADVDRTVGALRARLPGTLVGISTGAWIEPDADRRLACIDGWRRPPDHASVNLGEDAAPLVIGRLRARGVAIEAGLAVPDDARRLIESGLAPFVLRVLVEPDEGDPREALDTAGAILAVLKGAGIEKPVLLHGVEGAVWPLLDRAFKEGYAARIGLEDGDRLPEGGTAAGNPALVGAAFRRRPA